MADTRKSNQSAEADEFDVDNFDEFDEDDDLEGERGEGIERVFPTTWEEQSQGQKGAIGVDAATAAGLTAATLLSGLLLTAIDGVADGQTTFVSADAAPDWEETLLEIKGESKKLTDLTGPRGGDVFQQGVAQVLDTVTKHGADANGKGNITVELDPANGSNETQKALIEKRKETMDRLKREGWQVVQSKPGSVADMAGYDIIMVNNKGQWFPIDTTLDKSGKGRNNNLLIETNTRPFAHTKINGEDGTVRLRPDQQTFCDKAIDDLGKIMDRMGGPDGNSFPTLGELRPPSLEAGANRSHADILRELQEYREKVREFAGLSDAHQELLSRLDASIKHRQGIATSETNARANVERDLNQVLKDFAEKVKKGEKPAEKTTPDIKVADGKQTVSIDKKGNVTVNDTGRGNDAKWTSEKRTQLEIGDFRSMVDAQLETAVPDKATREKIRQMLDTNPEALNAVWGELSKKMADVTDLGRTTELSRRRPLNTKEAAEVEMTDKQAKDFFKELGKNGEGDRTDVRNKPTNELLEDLKKTAEKVKERQAEYDKVKQAYDNAEAAKKAAEAKGRTARADVIDAVRQNKAKLDNGFADLGTPEKPGPLRQQQSEVQNELSRRAREAFDKAFDMQALEYKQPTIEMMDALKDRATIVSGEKPGVVFRDKSTGKTYGIADLASEGKITTTSEGKPALKMEGIKEPIALDKLAVEIHVGNNATPHEAQRQILQGLTEIHQAMTFDERRFGGNQNTTKASEQLKADREHLENDFAKKSEQSQKQAEREMVIEETRKILGELDLNNKENKELVEEALREAIEKNKERVSEETLREMTKEAEAYKRGEAAAVEKVHKELAPPAEPQAKPVEPTPPSTLKPAPVEPGGQALFEKLPDRLKKTPPDKFSPDVKDALAEVLEANRSKWKTDYVQEMEKLLKDYGAEDKAAVERVNKMISDAKGSGPSPASTGGGMGGSTNGTGTGPKTGGDRPAPSGPDVALTEPYKTPELNTDRPAAQRQAIETLTSPDGLKFIEAIPIDKLTVAHVEEKVKDIDKEIARAREKGLTDYAEQLERVKREYESKTTPAEKEAYCREVVDRLKEAHETAKGGKKGSGIGSKAGTVVALLMVGGFMLDVVAPTAVAKPTGPRVMPSK